MALDFSKPIQTRDGRKVRVLCTDAKRDRPVLGLVHNEHIGIDDLCSWPLDGKFREEDCADDIVNVPQKRWVNLALDDKGEICIAGDFSDQANARRDGQKFVRNYLKTVEVEIPQVKP